MKLAICFLVMLQGLLLGAAEMEVRKYQLSEGEFRVAHRALTGGEGSEGVLPRGDDWLGEVVKPGFESRFFGGDGTWRDCSKRVGDVLFLDSFEGQALMNQDEKMLVMKAGEEEHENFARLVGDRLPKQIRVTTQIYSVPGVVSGMRSAGLGKGAKLLGSVSGMHLPGQTAKSRTPGGEIEMETEVLIDANDDILEARMTLSGKFEEIRFFFRSGFTVPVGMSWSHELGSLDGKESFFFVMTPEVVMMNGTLEDSWISKEEGGAFLSERRLERMKIGQFEREEGEFREILVPPTFLTFIGPWEEAGDPFAAEPEGAKGQGEPPVDQGKHKELAGVGVVYDARRLLEQNGLTFREGDFAVFSKARSMLYAKLSQEQHFLLEGIVGHGDCSLPRMIRLDFEKLDGEGRILKKIGVLALPGQTATVSLGPNLKVEVEAQIDANDSMVETRFKLAGPGGNLEQPSLQTGLTLRNGTSAVVQKTVSDETNLWRLTTHIVEVEKVVADYMEGGKR